MLETVRQYGIDRLTERGVLDAVRLAHAHHFVRMASEHYAALRRPNDADRVFAAIDADIANLRAAHAWLVDCADVDALVELAVSLFDFAFQAMRPEIFAWVEASLDVVAADDPRRAELLDSVCYGRWQFGDVDGAWAALREGLALAEPGTRAHRGLVAANMNLEGRAGNLDVAIPLAIEAAALAAAAGDTVWFAVERFQELLFRGLAGDASAAEDAERWTVEAQSEGNSIVSCWARYAAGEVLAADDPERARRHIDAALEHAEACSCRFVKGVAGLTAASLEARNGDPRAAAAAYRELLEFWQIGSLGPIGVTIMRGVVEVLASLGDAETAAILHGGVAVSDAAPAFGPDAYRQSALNRRLRRDLGEAAFEAAVERGGQLDDDELRELAADALDNRGLSRSPARPIAADSEGRLADDLVGERHGAGMETARPDVAVETFELAGLEHRLSTGDIDGDVDHALGTLGGAPLGGQDLHRPTLAVVDASREVGRQAIDDRPHRVELEVHLADAVLDHRVIGERSARDPDRRLARGGFDRQLERPLGDPDVDVGDQCERPDVQDEEERIGVVAGRENRPDPVVGDEDAVELGVVALRGADAERVPCGTIS